MTEPSGLSALTRALIVAALFLGITAVIELGSPDYIDADVARRLGVAHACVTDVSGSWPRMCRVR